MNESAVIVNGELGGSLSSLDRGLLFGDGVFETIAVRQGQPEFWTQHMQRLQLGCQVLKIPTIEESLLKDLLNKLYLDEQHYILKIIITRGEGSQGYAPQSNEPTVIVQSFPWPEFPQEYKTKGVSVTLCNLRLSHQTQLSKIKHLNRLEQVMARSEWSDEYQEGLVLDIEDNLIEATSSNVFVDINNELITPDLTKCGVEGIYRNQILEYLSNHKIPVSTRQVKMEELSQVQGMFLTNCIHGIWPVNYFNDRKMSKTDIINKLMSVFG